METLFVEEELSLKERNQESVHVSTIVRGAYSTVTKKDTVVTGHADIKRECLSIKPTDRTKREMGFTRPNMTENEKIQCNLYDYNETLYPEKWISSTVVMDGKTVTILRGL